ncbi:nuclear transport factor 2 family protein [Amycolatopsis dendrobii]|uniref:Nuclear transport factor 2 family protein n=1 Tax=Amycolatopsis dendrobii TaxID=2760662 RepID=A0A7W3VR58_9PSEU|nr:nuclear transport factor 2 family protein [Amycolatopsis dendrobii]MBB1151644.1 nuclear transport factor 2 family protein [Amycolatopsis dendrobii]
MADDPVALATSLLRALEAGQCGEDLREHFAPTASTVEHPNRLKPEGARANLDQMLAASEAGAGLMSSQRYEVRSAVAAGDTAILRLTWSGVIARDAGPFRRGDELVAHIAQFVETAGGAITSIETFDCYEPFDL